MTVYLWHDKEEGIFIEARNQTLEQQLEYVLSLYPNAVLESVREED